MASIAAGRDEEAFKWFLTTKAVEVRISRLRTGRVCPKGSTGWKHSPGQHQHLRGSRLFPTASLWCFPSPRLGNRKVFEGSCPGTSWCHFPSLPDIKWAEAKLEGADPPSLWSHRSPQGDQGINCLMAFFASV